MDRNGTLLLRHRGIPLPAVPYNVPRGLPYHVRRGAGASGSWSGGSGSGSEYELYDAYNENETDIFPMAMVDTYILILI